MLSKFTTATLLVAAIANAQTTFNPGDACTGSNNYCVGGVSGQTNIILRCDGSKLYPGNCNDNLNEPEFGALCIESSPTAGDAQCSAVAGPSSTTAPISSTTSSQPAGYSATGCPSTYDPTCAYFCGEAQVPFGLCESTDITGQFASCSKCPTAGSATPTTTMPVSYTTTTTPPPVYSTPSSSSSSSSSSSTCSPYSAAACPAVADSCCAYLCGEAQVPFPICQSTDGTGQFASCSKCPAMGSMTSAPSSYVAPTVVVVSTTPTPPNPTVTIVPAGNGTVNATTYTGVPSPTYIAGAASVAGGATIGLVVVMGFVGLLGML